MSVLKSELLLEEIELFSRIIKQGKVFPARHHVNGLFSNYQKFIMNFARKSELISNLLRSEEEAI